jgi:hypothetical protein
MFQYLMYLLLKSPSCAWRRQRGRRADNDARQLSPHPPRPFFFLAVGWHPPPHPFAVCRSASTSTRVTILAGNPPSVSMATSVLQANTNDGRVVVSAAVQENGNENVVLQWSSPDLTPEQFEFALLSSPTDLNLVRA